MTDSDALEFVENEALDMADIEAGYGKTVLIK